MDEFDLHLIQIVCRNLRALTGPRCCLCLQLFRHCRAWILSHATFNDPAHLPIKSPNTLIESVFLLVKELCFRGSESVMPDSTEAGVHINKNTR